MDLVILAAGMGSRFGGLKQIEPIDDNGNFIIDYSIYDAIKAGFNRVIFVIKEENYEIFKNTIGSRIEKIIETHYAFQSLDFLPKGYTLPSSRVKPLGTAQAILASKEYVKDSFIIINADDFYGRDAFYVAASFLKSLDKDSKNVYANVAYQVSNTMTENGSVKRGVLVINNNKLESLIESKIEKINNNIVASPLDNTNPFIISNDTLVSMNMFCFTKDIFKYIEDNFKLFLDNNKNNLNTCEYLIPSLVSDLITQNIVTCKVLSTTSIWYGITYKEDKDNVIKSINNLINNNVYPKKLWSK